MRNQNFLNIVNIYQTHKRYSVSDIFHNDYERKEKKHS